MRIPLEILRLVLNHAETCLSFAELLQLRMVSPTFDQEILSRLFSERRPLRAPLNPHVDLAPNKKPRLMNANVWHVAPQSLREKYIHYRLRSRTTEPSLFAYLFLPVYQRRLVELGIADGDAERAPVLDELLNLITRNKQIASSVAHKSSKTPILLKRTFPVADVESAPERKAARNLLRQKQADDDYLFMKFGFAVLNDESIALAALEQGVNLKRQSLCFGISMFEFCIHRGSINMLRRVLEHDPTLISERKNKYSIFAAAAERPNSAREAVNLLLQYSRALQDPVQRKYLLEFLSRRAGEYGHLAVVGGILDWLDEYWHPNSCVFPLPNTSGDYAARESAALWFNGPECRHWLLQRVYANVLRAKSLPFEDRYANRYHYGRRLAGRKDIFFSKPEIALLHLLLKNGVDVDDATHTHPGNIPPLYRAVQRGLVDWAEAILQAGGRPFRDYPFQNLLYDANVAGVFEEIKVAVERCGHTVVVGEWVYPDDKCRCGHELCRGSQIRFPYIVERKMTDVSTV